MIDSTSCRLVRTSERELRTPTCESRFMKHLLLTAPAGKEKKRHPLAGCLFVLEIYKLLGDT